MSDVTEDMVRAALANVRTPDGVALSASPALSGIVVTSGKVYLSVTVDASQARAWESVRGEAEEIVRRIPGVASALVALTAERKAGGPRPAAPPAAGGHGHGHSHGQARAASGGIEVPGVANIIAVASGKGGVGKSTVSINLALGLRDLGLKVGLLDADIYGPSVPRIAGVHAKPEVIDGKTMLPLENFGLQLMSIGFMVEEDTPMIWRGPMVMSAISQMLREVKWGPLDVLVVDMPPGTGDAQLTMAQQVSLAGAVIVSTPQDLALIDARRGIAMFQRVNVPILGVVENMATFVCPHCGGRSDIFGHGGARAEAEKLKVPFLGEIPLHMRIREMSDAGVPIMVSDPDSPQAADYRAVAEKVKASLSRSGTSARPAPRIVIE
ncbi:iron-sulfur cluster carrier protein [Azorhizobium oxalatiphilum]|uniref:Iron-sulfur cluster carrier protein n=1 Tax=Azorhizobium oxalatiphilum TaxID=980631 RepID=A0A917BNL6_9HYPH|nr:Mrp/NBP35 family ATP-binding protein [Azorhizobium oxalatiphilum]GGF51770.1 iron-sulfur cluster carrier protein [Azorhizobium oxalatiphilum]